MSINTETPMTNDTLLRERLPLYRPVQRVLHQLLGRGEAIDFAQRCQKLLQEQRGLEIGGPSVIFSRRNMLPVYPCIAGLDNCNFAQATIWEGKISAGATYQYDPVRPAGRQFICEGTDLSAINDEVYEFLLSSHTLEHMANPLRALAEWQRVVQPGGAMLLIVPHREGTFDHYRPVTTLAHLVDDLDQGIGEDDLTHLPEILELHDLNRDRGAGDRQSFMQRSQKNHENRCLHHHVFDTRLAVEMVNQAGLQIVEVQAFRPQDIFVVARKPAVGQVVDNHSFLSTGADCLVRSRFASEQMTRRAG